MERIVAGRTCLLLLMLTVCMAESEILPTTICQEEMCSCDAFAIVSCNCTRDDQEVTVRAEGPYKILPGATGIEIHNCQRVFFLVDSIKYTERLKFVKLSGVSHLTLFAGSLSWEGAFRESDNRNNMYNPPMFPGPKIVISNTTIAEIPSHAIKGHISNIIINNTRIRNIRPFAFATLKSLERIEIIDSFIEHMDTQAFKKFSVDKVHIKGGHFNILPSRAFSDVEVDRIFKLENVTIDKIKSSALILTKVQKFEIEDCTIRELEGDAFRVITRGDVRFRNNTIYILQSGALSGIGVYKYISEVSGPKEFIFEDNTITVFERGSFNINETSFERISKNIKIKRECDCSKWNMWEAVMQNNNNIFCIDPQSKKYNNLNKFETEKCTSNRISLQAMLSVILGSVVLVLALVLAIVCLMRWRSGKQVGWINRKKENELSVILPDGRTYRETELHVIVERADLLITDL